MEDTNKNMEAGKGLPAGLIEGVWDFFKSIKLTVFLLIILALVSIIGTIVDQTDPNKNIPMLQYLFGPQNAHAALGWLDKLGLTNMYHSWWFVGLLSMLSVNIAICTLDRFPRSWRIMRKVQEPLTDEMLRGLTFKQDINLKSGATDARAKAAAAMKSIGFSPKEEEKDGAVHLYSEKGKYSRMGVWITHSSVLIIFVGAIVGSFWGFKGYVQIVENSTVDTIGITSRPLLRNIGDEYKLGFGVRCDKFELLYYGRSQMPKDFKSDLTVIDNGQEVMKKTIEVNDPLQYKRVRFYQSSYGVMPGMGKMTIRASATGGDFRVKDYALAKGEKVQLDGTGYSMEMVDMAPDVVMGQGNQLVRRSDQFKGSGAAILNFYDEHDHLAERTAVMNMDPSQQPRDVPVRLSIVNYRGPFYTGLQVTYDPGVWVVYLGCFMMVMGILIAFFTYHKRVWVRISAGEKGRTTITVAGGSNKNRHVFDKELSRLVDKLGD